jgi:hypothetical protein
MRYRSLPPTPVNSHGGATALVDLRANEGVAVARKHLELTTVLAVVVVEAERCRGGLATRDRSVRWRPERTPMRQITTGCIPGEAKASTTKAKSRRARGKNNQTNLSPYPNSIGAAALMACDKQHLNC